MQWMLDSFPEPTLKWHTVHMGRGSKLTSNIEYLEFLAASTKDGADSNQNKRIRVNVQRSSDDLPKEKRLCAGEPAAPYSACVARQPIKQRRRSRHPAYASPPRRFRG